MTRSKQWWWRSTATGLVAALVACGGSDSPSTPQVVPTPAPTPAPTPTPGVLLATGTFTLTRNQLGIADFTTDRRGTLDVEIRYQHDSSEVLIWVTDRQCNRWQFERDQCFYLVKSLEGPNPRRLAARGVPPGTYTLFAHNATQRVVEEMTYEVVLTPE
jgi:hypothetical protein